MARGLLSRSAMRGWLILALIGLPGCFDAHGRVAPGEAIDAGVARDASARPDAVRPRPDAGGPIIAPGACTPVTPDAAHAPIAVGIGEPIPVHVRRLAGEGCGCIPEGRRWIGREGPLIAGLEVCGCSDEDPCVDPGYEATVIAVESASAGVARVTAAASVLEVAVVDPAECGTPLRVRGVAIEVPSGRHIPASGLGVWARIELEAAYCCVEPRSYVRTLDTTSPGAIALDVRDCNTADCFCDPSPVSWDHWHWLGELGSGVWTLSVGDAVTTFSVP